MFLHGVIEYLVTRKSNITLGDKKERRGIQYFTVVLKQDLGLI